MSLFLTLAALLLLGNQHSTEIHQFTEAAKYFYTLPTELPTDTQQPIKEIPILFADIPLEPRIRPFTTLHSSATLHTSSGQKLIALTFDDGPSKKETPRLLDILKKEQVKSTFFVLGKNAAAYPDIIKRAADEGHEIENHSWDHKDLTKLSPSDVLEEISQTDNIIKALTRRTPHFLRPPYGAINKTLQEVNTHTILLWSIDTKDWKYHDSTYIDDLILKQVKDRDIILLHDIHATSVDATALLIPLLKEQGFTFVTVEELLSSKTDLNQKGTILRHG